MKYSSKKVRKDFIDFFLKKEHKFVRSSPVMAINDPTLMFTNAGMNQFKDIFLGKEEITYKRAVNSQKCIRVSGKHNDLEEVGVDEYHHTFFEMLGTWSFGDYSKKEAIMWHWELLTDVWKLDKDRLWVTVYKDDDESMELWKEHTDVDPSRILKFGDKDNFWEMGNIGPCGPCTEIHYYTGDISKQDAVGVNKLPEYRELGNLVFIESNRLKDGSLQPLPLKHVDTGTGLERVVATLNGIDSNYETDLFIKLINDIEKKSNTKYSSDEGMCHRVIADHIRMISFSIADGIMPSNEGRGYVVRRVLRRAVRYAQVLDISGPFLFSLVDSLCDIMGEAFPELIDKKKHITNVIKVEEESFGKTLDRGLSLIDDIIVSSNNKIISGQEVFKLYDTYGFPSDLTELIAKERGFSVDLDAFEKHMEVQKDKARKGSKFKDIENELDWNIIINDKQSSFVGYESYQTDSLMLKYRLHNDKYEVVMEKTPFYAESGGQVGDKGVMSYNETILQVLDTYKVGDDIRHLCILEKGSLDNVEKATFKLSVDAERRNKIKANHTATHLLHKSLKNFVGNHVQQAGSLVEQDRLRFDLTHYEKLSSKQISQIEDDVNSIIINNIDLNVSNESYNDAKDRGAEALFGEKYGDVVRVVSIGDYSIELCGGTHVNKTGDIGLFKIISESSLASGVRRIEAITGKAAIDYVNKQLGTINNIKNKLKCNVEDIDNKLDELLKISKESSSLKKDILKIKINGVFDNLELISNDKFSIYFSEIDFNIEPKIFMDKFSDSYSKDTIMIIGMNSANPFLLLAITKGLSEQLNAGQIIKDLASSLDLGGGGPKHFGTIGFKNKDLYKKAYSSLIKLAERF